MLISKPAEWYPINTFIKSSYRKPQSFINSAISIFEWHNETLNIHTHLWPGIVILTIYLSAHAEDYYIKASVLAKICISVGYLSQVFMFFSSAFAHTFYIIDKDWCRIIMKIDFVGIILVNFSHQLLDSFLLFKIILKSDQMFIISFIIESIFADLCILDIIFNNTGRFWGVLYPAISSLPLTVSVCIYSYYQDTPILYNAALASLKCSAFVFIAGIVFFKGKIPERLWPGLFDNINSHVFHHICIVMSIYFANETIPLLHILEL